MVRLVYLTLAVAVAIGISDASAQTNARASSRVQSMTGEVKAVSVSSLTLERLGNVVVFGIDPSTRVIARGPARDLVLRTPDPGRRLTNVVKTGDQVTVRYRRSGSARNAVEVRAAQK